MKYLIIILLVSLTIVSCDKKEDSNHYPTSETISTLETIEAEKVGMDQSKIDLAYSKALEIENLYSLLIVKNGFLVAEDYFDKYTKDSIMHIRSVTKSVVSALIGKAIEEGFIESINDPLSKYISEAVPELTEEKGRLTSRRASNSSIASPSPLSHFVTVPSITDSPNWGIMVKAYEVQEHEFYQVGNVGGTRAAIVFDLIYQIAFGEYDTATTNYYVNEGGQNVLFGKYISRSGQFEGFIRGTYHQHSNYSDSTVTSGYYTAQIFNAERSQIGVLEGKYRSAEDVEHGFMQGRWKIRCRLGMDNSEDSMRDGM